MVVRDLAAVQFWKRECCDFYLFYQRPVLAFCYCHYLRLSAHVCVLGYVVCVCVCVCVWGGDPHGFEMRLTLPFKVEFNFKVNNVPHSQVVHSYHPFKFGSHNQIVAFYCACLNIGICLFYLYLLGFPTGARAILRLIPCQTTLKNTENRQHYNHNK